MLRVAIAMTLALTATIASAQESGPSIDERLQQLEAEQAKMRQQLAEREYDERHRHPRRVRAEGRIFFANVQRIGESVWPMVESARPSVLLLDFSAITDVEYTALNMLCEAWEKLRGAGRGLWIAGLNPAVFEVVERSRLGAALGHERMFLNMQAALEKFQQRGER